MPDPDDVLVYGEISEGKLAPATLELLGAGRRLADARAGRLSAVLIHREPDGCAREAVEHGADRVYVIRDAPTERFEGASYTAVLERLCRETARPAILLFGHTLTGRDLAPRLAFRLKTGLVTDCVRLDLEDAGSDLMAVKPVSGGNVLATYRVKEGTIRMATVRRRAVDPLDRNEGRTGEIVPVPAGADASSVKARFVERIREDSEGPNIENAEIVVSGGRGIDSQEEFRELNRDGLARVLGAGVGGTRGAVDAGLISEQHQVGLTGKIVGPNLYFAVALSGSIQHMAGCSGSRNIVAINTDENAQVFKFARFGIVGDYRQVLPPLIEKIAAKK